jgi:hypothetical protein
VAALFTEGRHLRGVERARITFEIAPDRAHWGAEIAGKVKAWAKALTGDVGQVDGLYRRCLRLQMAVDDELEQAHPLRLDGSVRINRRP